MTAAAHPARACWRVLLLAALAVVLALLLPSVPASAAALPAAETRVGASGPATAVAVGVHECITAGQRPVRGPSQLQVVVGNCVAAEAAGPAELAGGMRALLAQRAGFSGSGTRLIVDENLPGAFAPGLRAAGYDARSVSEMGLRGAKDPQLNQLADQVGARVLTRDVGHDIGGGFGSNGIVLDSRVRSLDTILRILAGG